MSRRTTKVAGSSNGPPSCMSLHKQAYHEIAVLAMHQSAPQPLGLTASSVRDCL
ncbi:predicted protein [Plenodomus lingam JN3]|uniref:Predicted protein n=1 Tax=Leptosphaeria maculans (strain JN3 / isolate v23.1.3 / race Av1-4-5-6-7-8) TaxID=985895 RepID=E5ADH3_LEPMJ|nr:predicted protein [Plenodomus lingam JN3]CBY01262.1 predicted protein [Plenodomus lingam JN3]